MLNYGQEIKQATEPEPRMPQMLALSDGDFELLRFISSRAYGKGGHEQMENFITGMENKNNNNNINLKY